MRGPTSAHLDVRGRREGCGTHRTPPDTNAGAVLSVFLRQSGCAGTPSHGSIIHPEGFVFLGTATLTAFHYLDTVPLALGASQELQTRHKTKIAAIPSIYVRAVVTVEYGLLICSLFWLASLNS